MCVRQWENIMDGFLSPKSEVGVCDVANWLFNVLMDGAMREAKGNLQGGVQLTTIPTCRCYFSWMI